MRHQAHGGRSVPEGLFNLTRVDDEERGRKRGLVFLRGIRPVVPHVGFRPSRSSPRMAGTQIALQVERHLEVSGQHLQIGGSLGVVG